MVHLVNSGNKTQNGYVMDSMFRERKKVFIDILKWEIVSVDGKEIDQFDDDFAEYLIVYDSKTKIHMGSVRLLRTDRPHILGNLFPQLCDMPIPTGPDIREITRLCLSPRLCASERLQVRNRLATALVEYALLTGITSYTGVAELGWLNQILALGWRCDPLGIPKPIGKSLLGALQIHVATDTINLLRKAGTYASSELKLGHRPLVA
ncbi:acyl-homoserine-lactone synthase [Sphingobium sp. 15-1]|uniref:acyl-homoserine-lactone synthase n=1 Tax=Sphingobium sp. 15-1 TaxID=2729616 RepID=UPI00159C3E30|nr:acyl-homoserine-lactone synthase [Sphingobium sp. 15-1]